MATGPQHYATAEQLLRTAHRFTYGDGSDPAAGQALATEALAHATLALAAATALSDAGAAGTDEGGMPLLDYDAWTSAASATRPTPVTDPTDDTNGDDEDEGPCEP